MMKKSYCNKCGFKIEQGDNKERFFKKRDLEEGENEDELIKIIQINTKKNSRPDQNVMI